MFYLDKEITSEMVEKYIDIYRTTYLPRLQKLKRYYDCKNDTIMNRTFKDVTKPNTKIASPWSNYITTLSTGYFMGKPVTYSTPNDTLNEYLHKNNTKEISHNAAIEKDCSVYGLAAEILYINDKKEVDFARVEPTSIIPIYSTSIDRKLKYVIRFWGNTDILSNKSTTHVEVYSDTDIKHYTYSEGGTVLVAVETHHFKEVPINIFYNNDDGIGDFEKVIKLIDAYDLALSDTANFRAELNDSYLVFKNTNLDTSDILTMKENKIIQIEDSQEGSKSDVDWLNKDSNDTENENYKNRLADDIKKFSFVNDIEGAKSHTSATSAKIGLLGIEQVCSDKETHFRKALLRRLQLISNVFNMLGSSVELDNVVITFVRNIPIDLSVIGDTIAKLLPIVSKETLLSQIPFVNDVKEEMRRIENESSIDSYEVEGDLDEPDAA